ncbi:UDP-glucose/GDP-mannose dehydrogenase family protein [Suttonella sp. R2A3]|uniref:UDP-glucose dehydrogenase family protein n=1 Tax=Suttonella sp. R2A3 TaxID=2908648 RepID=UPI001F40D9C8|nr:UDP-glucose/GDP-mannose dehydrogenase family protein [Suttonella sp. R2A3]UJF24820.1 UDP-glucose/GDP-mannose dehydrogenase family protein [Suttonella sp. R2A3]
MRISFYGCGYVGLVSAALLADSGNNVLAMDIDANRVAQLSNGQIPIYEPGLEAIVQRNIEQGRLWFTTDVQETVRFGEIQFIAVGTPNDADGNTDLSALLSVAESIGRFLEHEAIIVNKSTAPIGTAHRVKALISEAITKRNSKIEFDMVVNPEFLKEGAAVADFMRPDRIIIGADNDRPLAKMRALYSPFNRNHNRIMTMDIHSAELTKYAANAMLATRISFINEMAAIAEQTGADIDQVRLGIGADPRIGYDFLYAGCGFGGSCFPKDLRALNATARAQAIDAPMLEATMRINEQQKLRLFRMVEHCYPELGDKQTFAIWGGAFKANTDDIRETPAIPLIKSLLAKGCHIRLHDPQAMKALAAVFTSAENLTFHDTPMQAISDADALIIVTDWRAFQSPDFIALKETLRDRLIIDGRNLYDPALVASYGLRYYGIGRGLPTLNHATKAKPSL